jgi:hypothetical protein
METWGFSLYAEGNQAGIGSNVIPVLGVTSMLDVKSETLAQLYSRHSAPLATWRPDGKWLAKPDYHGGRQTMCVFDTREQAAFAFDEDVRAHNCQTIGTNFSSLAVAAQAASQAEAEYALLNMLGGGSTQKRVEGKQALP